MADGLRRDVRGEAACFVLVTAVYLAHFWRSGYDRFYHDAQGYWDGGELFGKDGAFSLVAFDDPIRGYALPLFNFLLQTVAGVLQVGDVTIVRISGALLAATLGVVVAPRLARAIFPGAETTWPRVLALNGILFVFWRDHFQFPLSDFPTLLATSVGVIGLLRRTPGGYLAAGLCFGLAVNMRPAYVPVALIGLLAVVLVTRGSSLPVQATATALFIVPMILVSLPQVAVNHHHRGGWSPTAPSPAETSRGLLTWGLQAQKYETYVGPEAAYPSAKVFYLDPTRGSIDPDDLPVRSHGAYARIVLENPLSTTAGYLLHLFNGLDVRYPTPYIRDLLERPLALPLFQFTLLFLAVTQLVLPEARRRLGDVRWLGTALLASPVVVTIAFAAEPRFLLGIHLLAYVLVCFSPAFRASFFPGGVKRPLSLVLTWGVVLTTCLLLSEATQRQIEHPLGGEARSSGVIAAGGSRAGPHAR